MVRYVKIILVFCIGLFGVVGAATNLLEIPSVYKSIETVTSMSRVPEHLHMPWATTSPIVVWGGVLLVIVGKLTAVFGGVFGGALMLRHVKAPKQEFERSKRWALAGCGLTFGLLILSFTIVSEASFMSFYSPPLESAGAFAFRLSGSFALITIFVALPEAE